MGAAMAVRAKSRDVGRQVRTIIGEPGHVMDFQKSTAIRARERSRQATALASAIGSQHRIEVYSGTTTTVLLQANNTKLRFRGVHV
ncbi:hypothetical protein AO738_13975 [Pseudomonas citronellolis]|nr:hypothetical protein AO742_12290 [Pseudomonas citronellolis]KRW79654.1 hypothetical protein AO738_13975 [Pseudomonas citronellolis]